MVNFIKGEWYTYNGNSHLYQFKEIKNNKFITNAWIHLGSFNQSYRKEFKELQLVCFDPNKKAPENIVKKFLPKIKIYELW